MKGRFCQIPLQPDFYYLTVADGRALPEPLHILAGREVRFLHDQQQITHKLGMAENDDKRFGTAAQPIHGLVDTLQEMLIRFGIIAIYVVRIQMTPIGNDPWAALGRCRAGTGTG